MRLKPWLKKKFKCISRKGCEGYAQRAAEKYKEGMVENDISYRIIGAAIELHKRYGPGMLESAWENALAYDLREAGLEVNQQVALPFVHKEMKMDIGYRIDLIVENKVVVEVKNVEAIAEVHKAQILTYLKLSGKKLGLLINFNTTVLKDGIYRYANNL